MKPNSIIVTPYFKWFDFWVGIYYNRDTKSLYICPLPMIGIKIQLGKHFKDNGTKSTKGVETIGIVVKTNKL